MLDMARSLVDVARPDADSGRSVNNRTIDQLVAATPEVRASDRSSS
jgi:hypothetical protein